MSPPLPPFPMPPTPRGIAFDPVPSALPRRRPDAREAARICRGARRHRPGPPRRRVRIGVSPQAVNRVRRRADAKRFDLACTAAQRFGARHLQAIAFERAIQGTVRRHHYHGELISEEVVYDNRLLIYLLGKTAHLLDEPGQEARGGLRQLGALYGGARARPAPPALGAAEEAEVVDFGPGPPLDDEVWQDEGRLLTNVPAPPGFAGYELGRGTGSYQRELTEAEDEVWANVAKTKPSPSSCSATATTVCGA